MTRVLLCFINAATARIASLLHRHTSTSLSVATNDQGVSGINAAAVKPLTCTRGNRWVARQEDGTLVDLTALIFGGDHDQLEG
jgi:hypothetical protein